MDLNAVDVICPPTGGLPTAEETARLGGLFLRIQELGALEGLALVPFHDASLPYFQKLSSDARAALTRQVTEYVDVMSESSIEDRSVLRNSRTLWRMLGRLRWRPAPDLFESLRDEFVIEIYDADGLQIFRSFNFFPLCTYTLEEIYTLPWFELYDRDEARFGQTLDIVRDVLTQPQLGTRPMVGGVHEVRERKGPVRRCTTIRPEVISPLHDSGGDVCGFVHSFSPLSWVDRIEPDRA